MYTDRNYPGRRKEDARDWPGHWQVQTAGQLKKLWGPKAQEERAALDGNMNAQSTITAGTRKYK